MLTHYLVLHQNSTSSLRLYAILRTLTEIDFCLPPSSVPRFSSRLDNQRLRMDVEVWHDRDKVSTVFRYRSKPMHSLP